MLEGGERGTPLAGRYTLLDLLGEGGMGKVWRAWDDLLGREVAVKELTAVFGLAGRERDEACARALREARAASVVRHPGVVVVHDAFTEGGRPWIVMQLLHGRPLDRVLRDGPLTPEETARLGVHLLEALTALHEAGILHRDVKPANVFVTPDGRPVLTDFGIATIEGETPLTRTGRVFGSPGYTAPERLRGERAGPPSDLWSLAATLYRAVEGAPPFPGGDDMGVLARVLTGDPVPPVRAGRLGPLLSRMLARDVRVRPGPSDVARALERIAAGHEPDPLPRAPRVPLPATRRVRLAWAVLPVAAVLVAACVVLLRRDGPAPSARPTPTPPSATLHAGFTETPRVCALIPLKEIRAALPRFTPAGGEESADPSSCAWDVPGVAVRLKVTAPAGLPWPEATPRRAHEDYVSSRNARVGMSEFGWSLGGVAHPTFDKGSKMPAEDVDDIGDEAFAYDTRSRGGARMTTVVFRVANALFILEHGIFLGTPDASAVHARALALARTAADAATPS